MIWIVCYYNYEESTPVALFSSKDAAEAWVAARKSDRWSGYRVEDEPLTLDAEASVKCTPDTSRVEVRCPYTAALMSTFSIPPIVDKP